MTRYEAAVRRAQLIAEEVNREMPDADDIDNFREYERRVNDPYYQPKDR